MLFSVLIPVYNVEKYLKECIESVLNQKVQDYEVILVDDGSTDKSGEICDEYQMKYPNKIKVVHQSNQGLLKARRTAFKVASGMYCICCDSDDRFKPDLMECLENEIKITEPDLIIFNMDAWSKNQIEPFTRDIFTHDQRKVLDNKDDLYIEFLTNISINSMCCKAIKRVIVDQETDYSGFSKISNGEDSLQSIAVFENAKSIVYLNKSLYEYRVNETGMTKKFNPEYIKAFAEINKKIEKSLINEDFLYKQEYVAIHMLFNVYLSLTQMKFQSCKYSFQQKIAYIDSIINDSYIGNKIGKYHTLKKNLKTIFNIKQRFILWLLVNNHKNIIVLILSILRSVEGAMHDKK